MVLFATIAVLYFAKEILIPFAFALILTFVLAPVVALLQRLRIGRVISVLAILLGAIALAGGVGWIIANQLVDVVNQLPNTARTSTPRSSGSHPCNRAAWPRRRKCPGDRARAYQSGAPPPAAPAGQSESESAEFATRGRVSCPRSNRPNPTGDGRSFAIWARRFSRLWDGREWWSSSRSSCC